MPAGADGIRHQALLAKAPWKELGKDPSPLERGVQRFFILDIEVKHAGEDVRVEIAQRIAQEHVLDMLDPAAVPPRTIQQRSAVWLAQGVFEKWTERAIISARVKGCDA